MDLRVCALVVTYNRCKYLAKLLDALLSQSHPIREIVIFDNCSTDETQNYLYRKGIVEHPLEDGSHYILGVGDVTFHTIRSAYNSGGSGGFHDGLKYASNLGCDYVWMMDDDVLPEVDCLWELISYMTKERRICIPNRTGDGFVDHAIVGFNMSNPFLYTANMRKKMISADRLQDNVVSVVDMPFEGPLIDASLIEEIGLPKRDLVIIYDDTEYCYRAVEKTEVGFVQSAHMRKQIVPQKDRFRFMGWKEYYSYRNQYWFDVTYGTNIFVKVMRPILNVMDLSFRAIIRRKWSNFRVLFKSYVDGTRGNLGITIKPGERV